MDRDRAILVLLRFIIGAFYVDEFKDERNRQIVTNMVYITPETAPANRVFSYKHKQFGNVYMFH